MTDTVVDIVVTTHNRLEFLRRTMDSFFSTVDVGMLGTVIVADDGSTDGTAEHLEGLRHEHAGLVVSGTRDCRGLVPSFNDALAKTSAEYVCEFQDDVEFGDGWLGREVEALQANAAHKIDFVTGFDALEHCTSRALGALKVKPSSRFTQLLASRTTWHRWFPMRSRYKFPTPCVRSGKRYGSNIDCNIYRNRKNNWKSGVKFLVIPGLVDHLAEGKESTWRH